MSASSVSRGAAVAAGLGTTALWAFVAFDGPQGGLAIAVGPSFWVAWMTFTALGLVAAAGALLRAPLVTLVAGFVSLVPVGLYFLVLPGVFRWIGLLDVLLVVAAGITWAGVRGADGASAENGA